MNLYKLHTNAKEELLGYANMNDLAHASIKTVQNTETSYRNVFGQLHRDDGPAITYDNNITEFWYRFGKKHRLDGPAATYYDGETKNFINGKMQD